MNAELQLDSDGHNREVIAGARHVICFMIRIIWDSVDIGPFRFLKLGQLGAVDHKRFRRFVGSSVMVVAVVGFFRSA